jgi:hypothetical protein
VELDYFRGLAFGVLRIPKSDFLIMTPHEVSIAYEEWTKVQEYREKVQRMVAYTIYGTIPANQLRSKKHVGIDTFWPMTGDAAAMEIKNKEQRQKQYKWLK